MTRINCIDPTLLNKKMLVAEYKELPRIFGWLEKVLEKEKEPVIPKAYCLGKGHMSFFANKLTYLNNRHAEIVQECLSRNIKVNFTEKLCWSHIGIHLKYWNDWEPDFEAQELNLQRINERIATMKTKPVYS